MDKSLSHTQNKIQKYIDIVIETISAIFLPLVNLLCASGIMKGLLVLMTTFHILTEQDGAYIIFNALSDCLFYFLPVMVALTAAKKFKTNIYTAGIIALILVYPSLTNVFDQGVSISFFGLAIQPVNYPSNIISVIMAVGLLHFLEGWLEKHLPEVIRGFLTPMISLIVITMMTLFVFGPIGTVFGDILALGYQNIYQFSPMLAGFFLGGLIQIMVIFGFHWSLIPIAITNIALNGSDTILALMGPAVFAQAGAALAVFFKTKDISFRSTCLSATLSALFGITEPAMFGVNLPLKKPMIAVCMAGAIGGAIGGLTGASAISFAFPGLMTIPVFVGNGFMGYCLSIVVGFVFGFIMTMLLKCDVYPIENK